MGRQARRLSESGMYHVIFRGVSRQNIFEEESDYEKMAEIITKVKKSMSFEIFAYCFMSNHVHLFLKEKEMGQISKIMAKILSHYATWYNIKYLRTGILFENRYKSEPVEDVRYFLGLARYIHQNPKKAGITEDIGDYLYSSYNEYVEKESKFKLADTYLLLDMLSKNKDKAIEEFAEYSNFLEEDNYEISTSKSHDSAYIRRQIMSVIDGKEPHTIKTLPKEERDMIVYRLVNELNISKSALERATGISRGTIIRIVGKWNKK